MSGQRDTQRRIKTQVGSSKGFDDPEIARRYLQQFLEQHDVQGELVDFSENVCKIFVESPLSEGERHEAEEILRELAHCVELQVRETLAEQLKSSKLLPPDVACDLANDVVSVALPVLEYSDVLSDKDLIQVIETKGTAYQCAIARREKVSQEVSAAIVDQGEAEPVETLLHNEGAEISNESFDNVIVLFPEHKPIKEALVRRPDLPIDMVGKLASLVADNLQFELITRHGNSAKLIERVVAQGNEGAIVALLGQYDKLDDAEMLAAQLFNAGRITPTVLVRALYFGQIDFLEFALSRLSQVNVNEVRRQLLLPKGAAFQRLYRRAELPAPLFNSFCEALLHIGAELTALNEKEPEPGARRRVTAMVQHPNFDIPEFEATLLMTAAN